MFVYSINDIIGWSIVALVILGLLIGFLRDLIKEIYRVYFKKKKK